MSDLNEIVMGRAYLFDVHLKFAKALSDHHLEQEYLLRFFNLQNKFTMLQLIVEKIKNAVKSPELAKKNNRLYYYFLTDLEAYFYLLISTLDILAKLTPHFYSKWEGDKDTRRYFSHQREFFRQNPRKDPKYARYLKDNMEWFKKVRGHRNELTHNGALIIFPASKKKFYFGTKRNEKGFIPNEEVETCIGETFQGFCDFLIFYNSHFGDKPLKILNVDTLIHSLNLAVGD